MGDLIVQMFSGFTTAISGMTSGIQQAFMGILYVDPIAEILVLSEVAKFGFLMFGLSLAFGLVTGAMALIRR